MFNLRLANNTFLSVTIATQIPRISPTDADIWVYVKSVMKSARRITRVTFAQYVNRVLNPSSEFISRDSHMGYL